MVIQLCEKCLVEKHLEKSTRKRRRRREKLTNVEIYVTPPLKKERRKKALPQP